MTTRFTSFPRTEPPPYFIPRIVAVFSQHESAISTESRFPHLKSNDVLAAVAPDLSNLGFEVELGRRKENKILRPVFFGEGGRATLRYEIDAFHPEWKCGFEIEAIRAIMGGAFYRDLIQALVMVNVDHLCIAVPNTIVSGSRSTRTAPYVQCCRVAEALYGHSRIRFPYGLTILGY